MSPATGMAAFDPTWNSAQLAKELCDNLVARGHLRDRPAFIRKDREEKITHVFESVSLDGRRMDSFTNPGPLEMLVRSQTEGLVDMLPYAAAHAEKQMEMDTATKMELAEAHERSKLRMKEGSKKGGSRPGAQRQPASGEACFACGDLGHFSRDCPESKGRGKDRNKCYSCGDLGHLARNCPHPSKGDKGATSRDEGAARGGA
eukprot:TRINITY_DN9188_c0_g1_i2.p1 TRINITY_DN9188_c0_g1~~TRINITY_DN9188_c0_g1_i2.p1  ORF type:complete len:217 (-),score=36.53 TRINITY_DN9188_c0_g1_i2:149-757(-)